jgi:GNAT superfamily N-acetyltransferase
MADGGAHGSRRYRRPVERSRSPSPIPQIRPVRPDELPLLPDLEAAADTVFEPLGIGPLPGPGAEEEFAAALIVLVAGEPPVGLCRIDAIGKNNAAHLEQLSVQPDHAGHGIGRALLRAACDWARAQGYTDLTLATYRDVPWNGPFYASEGFVELGPVDDFLRAFGLPPEEPVMGRFGARVLMVRSL